MHDYMTIYVCIYGTYVCVSVVKSFQTVRNALPKREFDIIPVIHRVKRYYNFMTNINVCNSQKVAYPSPNSTYIFLLRQADIVMSIKLFV